MASVESAGSGEFVVPAATWAIVGAAAGPRGYDLATEVGPGKVLVRVRFPASWAEARALGGKLLATPEGRPVVVQILGRPPVRMVRDPRA